MTSHDHSEPIAPGTALQDPALQEALRARAERRGRRRWHSMQAAYDGVDLPVLRHLLGSFPWQICDYRYGRWEWVREDDLVVIWWHAWDLRYDTVQLLDHAGRPFAELLNSRAHSLRAPGGRLRFAGDPAVAIACLHDGAPLDQVSLATSPLLKSGEALDRAVRPRPGQPQARQRTTAPPSPPSTGDPQPRWLADHPTRPRRRDRWECAG
jgi:hypothetical protein